GDHVGVAVDDLDVLDGYAQLLADEHGEGGGVALAVGRRARAHRDLAVGPDLHRAELAAGDAAGDLHVHGQADAQLHHVARLPAAALLLPQPVVARGLQGQVQASGVVPAVVGGPRRGGEGEGVGGYEVAS